MHYLFVAIALGRATFSSMYPCEERPTPRQVVEKMQTTIGRFFTTTRERVTARDREADAVLSRMPVFLEGMFQLYNNMAGAREHLVYDFEKDMLEAGVLVEWQIVEFHTTDDIEYDTVSKELIYLWSEPVPTQAD